MLISNPHRQSSSRPPYARPPFHYPHLHHEEGILKGFEKKALYPIQEEEERPLRWCATAPTRTTSTLSPSQTSARGFPTSNMNVTTFPYPALNGGGGDRHKAKNVVKLARLQFRSRNEHQEERHVTPLEKLANTKLTVTQPKDPSVHHHGVPLFRGDNVSLGDDAVWQERARLPFRPNRRRCESQIPEPITARKVIAMMSFSGNA